MLMRRVTGWIMVANGKECRIFTRDSVTGKLEIVKEITTQDSRLDDKEIGADKPGRVFESANKMRHSMEPRISFHTQAHQKFAKEIANFLNHAALQDRFHALTIVASSPLLGEVRTFLSDHVLERTVTQINKDLTHIPPQDLLSHLYRKTG